MTTGLVPIELRDESQYPKYTLDAFYGDNESAKHVFTAKYAAPEDYWNGQPNLYRFWERLAWGVAQAEKYMKRQTWYRRFLAVIKGWRYVFGGRINYGLGREGAVTSLQNCFAGTEQFVTPDGLKTFAELVDQQVQVLSPVTGQFVPAVVRSFGRQLVNEIVLAGSQGSGRNRVVHATANHRWPLMNGQITTQLKPGDLVKPTIAQLPTDREGFIHGLVFADGCHAHEGQAFHAHSLRLCGEKQRHLDDVTSAGHSVTYPPSANGEPVAYIRSDVNLKTLPYGRSPAYIASFIKGWVELDGHILSNNPRGRQIHTIDGDAMDFFVEHAHLAGFIVTGNVKVETKPSNFGPRKPLYRVVFMKAEDFRGFRVKSIEPLAEQDVFCVVEPQHRQFTLAGGVATGNCYTVPFLDDSLYGIYTNLGQTGRTYAKHGGVGNDISILRPNGSHLTGAPNGSPGAAAFADLISNNTASIAQEGRRGANMDSMWVEHPDIIRFVTLKNDGWPESLNRMARLSPHLAKKFNDEYGDRRRVSFSNISPQVSDAFMQAVLDNTDFDYWFPDMENCPPETDLQLIAAWRAKYKGYLMVYDGYQESPELEAELDRRQALLTVYDTRWSGNFDQWKAEGLPIKVYRREKAKILWDLLIDSAWRSAEPGILFRGNFDRDWAAEDPMLSTNPCGEVPLSPYESCNLGHRNFAAYVKHDKDGPYFDFHEFEADTPITVRMQDNIHDVNKGRHALRQQEEAAEKYRRLGIGGTGVADMLIMMKIRYDSRDAIDLMREIMRRKNEGEYAASVDLAIEKGTFPAWNLDLFEKTRIAGKLSPELRERIREHGLRNVAISTFAPVGSGGMVSQTVGGMEPMFESKFERRVKNEDGTYRKFVVYEPTIVKIFGKDPGELPDYVVTAHDLDLDMRVEMQAVIGEYTGNSVSSTINLPEDATREDVERVFMKAYELGLKGVTIYRDKCRAGILRLIEDDDESADGRLVARTPDELPALRIRRKAEGKTWYFIVTLKNGVPYELFIDTNNPEPNANADEAAEALIKLAQANRIDNEIIQDQLRKSNHQSNVRRLGRLLSLNLRHEAPIDSIIDTLHGLSCYHAGSVVFHVAKILAEQVPDGTTFKGDCPGCNKTGTIRYQGGCVTCRDCGYSKCG